MILLNMAGMFFNTVSDGNIRSFGSILLDPYRMGSISVFCLVTRCLTRKRRYSEMWEVLNGIQEKYLFPEILKCPYTEEERQYYDIMQVVSKIHAGEGRTGTKRKEGIQRVH